MKTLIVGKDSNLSRRLAQALPDAVLHSTRDLLAGAPLPVRHGEPLRVVVNSFQPATRLRDLSDPIGYVDRSIGATARLMAQLAEHQVVKLIYTSSASVYGDNVECRETDRLRASGLHAGLKVANEALVRQLCEERAVDCTIARLFNMYGGDDRFSIVARIVQAARTGEPLTLVNGGNAIRDFIWVGDVVRSYVALLDARDLPVVNVATGVGVSVRTVLDALELNGIRVPTRDLRRDEIRVSTAQVDVLASVVDVSSFRSVIEWVLAKVRA